MTRFIPGLVLLLALSLPLAACGGGDENSEPGFLEQAGQAANAARGMKDMADRMQEQAAKGPAEAVDFRRLKELLPERTAGLTMTESSGEKQQMGGFGVSQARATYADTSDAEAGRIEIEVIDLTGAGAMAMFGAAWTMMEMDKETSTGYERTREVDGYPGYEKYDSERRRGEMQTLVGDRYLVKAGGRDVEASALEDAVTDVDLGELYDMRDENRQPPEQAQS